MTTREERAEWLADCERVKQQPPQYHGDADRMIALIKDVDDAEAARDKAQLAAYAEGYSVTEWREECLRLTRSKESLIREVKRLQDILATPNLHWTDQMKRSVAYAQKYEALKGRMVDLASTMQHDGFEYGEPNITECGRMILRALEED